MYFTFLPKQPHPVLSYLRVGRLLYYSLTIFIVESWFYWVKLKAACTADMLPYILFWAWSFMFSFIHIFLVLADGWSRYQNYKRAKDQFFIHGFRSRIADTYMGSKCQRMAAIEAAKELGIGDEIVAYYEAKNVKWYHYIPYFMIRDPWFGFKKKFWSRTFLEGSYKSRFNFSSYQLVLQA